MSKEIFNIDDIDKETLSFNNIRESRGGSYIAEINNLKYIYLTKHTAKEGLSFNNKSCYVDLELTNNTFLNFLQEFDLFFKKAILHNSNEWFSYNLSEKQIEDFYVSLINYRKKFNKEPFLRLKIPISKQTISANICDDNNIEIDIERLPVDELILSGIIEIKGLKFLKQEVICEMELVSIIVHNAKPKLNITNLIKKNKKSNDDLSRKSNKKNQTNESIKNTNQINEQLENERLERERLEEERLERERLEEETLERERLERERLERERLERDRLEKERLERERLENEKKQREKIDMDIQKQREEQDEIDSRSIYSKTYSEYNRIEESQDKIIKDELINRLEREKNLAQTIFKEAHSIMELYEKKREEALRQAEIVKELEYELSNLE